MKTWSVKRRLLIGILIAGTIAGAGQAAGSYHKDLVLSSDPIARELQTLYGNLNASDIQIGKLESLPLQDKILSPEQRKQRLVSIQQELKRNADEQARYQVAAADTERAITAVQADFTRGVLSNGDKEVLMKLFSNKRDSYQQVVMETEKQNGVLDKEKQQIIEYQEPDHIQYGQARVDRGNSVITRTVFYNVTKTRLLTKDEIALQPAATQILNQTPDTEERKSNEFPLLASMGVSVLLAALIWRRLPKARRNRVPEFLRQGT